MYCKKCGRVVQDSKNCDCCQSPIYKVPGKYWLDGMDFIITNESKQLLIEELVKPSPEFDQYLFDHRDEILAKQSAEFNAKMAIGKAILEEKGRMPKCPTCGSTNIQKISVASKAGGAFLFGLFSQTARSQFKCENCGYKF